MHPKKEEYALTHLIYGIACNIVFGLGIFYTTKSYLWTAAAVAFISLPSMWHLQIIATLTMGAVSYFMIGKITWHFWSLIMMTAGLLIYFKYTLGAGLTNRRKYNGQVDIKLNKEYGILTRNNKNFPGLADYLAIVDAYFYSNKNTNECALGIATFYYCELAKKEDQVESSELLNRIIRNTNFDLEKGIISNDFYKECAVKIQAATDFLDSLLSPPATVQKSEQLYTENFSSIDTERAANEAGLKLVRELKRIKERTVPDLYFDFDVRIAYIINIIYLIESTSIITNGNKEKIKQVAKGVYLAYSNFIDNASAGDFLLELNKLRKQIISELKRETTAYSSPPELAAHISSIAYRVATGSTNTYEDENDETHLKEIMYALMDCMDEIYPTL